MGKGFQNFMSKKDFHPSAWWNLKKVWEAKEKKKLDEAKQEELRIQYEKEQEIMSNKALLGDEKAKLGLSFMYDAPTGMTKREEPKEEPKFEWQRKYNAPREEWAKGNDAIQDQPFGIQVRNVRCVKCHTWGHLNTDRECPLYGMSGNAENPGYANNPSDLLKEFRAEKEDTKKVKKEDDTTESEGEYEEVKHAPIDQVELLAGMKEDHGFNFKKNILHNIRSDDVLKTLAEPTDDTEGLQSFLKGMSASRRKSILARVFGKNSKEYQTEKAKTKALKDAKKKVKKEKKSRRSSSSSSSSEESEKEAKSTRKSRHSDRKRRRRSSSRDDRRRRDTSERKRRSSSRDDSRRRDTPERSRRRKHSYSRDESSRYSKRRRISDEECREKESRKSRDYGRSDRKEHKPHTSSRSRYDKR